MLKCTHLERTAACIRNVVSDDVIIQETIEPSARVFRTDSCVLYCERLRHFAILWGVFTVSRFYVSLNFFVVRIYYPSVYAVYRMRQKHTTKIAISEKQIHILLQFFLLFSQALSAQISVPLFLNRIVWIYAEMSTGSCVKD